MANHVSAVKRHTQSEKRRARNRSVKSALHTELKKTRTEKSPEALKLGQQALAVAARKGLISKKTAARRTSRLMKSCKAA